MIVRMQLNTWSIKPCNLEIKYVKATEGQDLDDWLIKSKKITTIVNQYRKAAFPANSLLKMNQIK